GAGGRLTGPWIRGAPRCAGVRLCGSGSRGLRRRTTSVGLPQHPDEHRPERRILLSRSGARRRSGWAPSRTQPLVNLLLCLLSTRRFLTAAQIAATVPGYEHDPEDPRDHEAFQRKFERDKAELRELGVPLETGTASVFDQEPGYRIAHREYALPDIILEPDEAAAVGIAARLWQHAGLAAAASSGLAKLRAAGA